MKEVRIKFVDFWPTFDWQDNNFVRAIKARHKVAVIHPDSDERPDLLFYSRCGSFRHYDYDCLKIYFTGENDFPDLNECDYALSFYDYDCGGRLLRYPLYMFYEMDQAASPRLLSDSEALNREFCSLVMRNHANCDPVRLEIIKAVEDYKPMAYGGAYNNNVGGQVAEKIPFIANYKFNLALENSLMPGYVTEKIIEPFAASTVPVYWGDEMVKRDFNPDSYIHVNDYANIDSFLRELKRLDSDSDAYLKMLRAPTRVRETVDLMNRRLEDFLDRIIENPVRRIAPYGEIANKNYRNRTLLPLSTTSFAYKTAKFLSRMIK